MDAGAFRRKGTMVMKRAHQFTGPAAVAEVGVSFNFHFRIHKAWPDYPRGYGIGRCRHPPSRAEHPAGRHHPAPPSLIPMDAASCLPIPSVPAPPLPALLPGPRHHHNTGDPPLRLHRERKALPSIARYRPGAAVFESRHVGCRGADAVRVTAQRRAGCSR